MDFLKINQAKWNWSILTQFRNFFIYINMLLLIKFKYIIHIFKTIRKKN